MNHILTIVDMQTDEILPFISILENQPHNIVKKVGSKAALESLEKDAYDAVVIDCTDDDIREGKLLEDIVERFQEIQCVMLTRHLSDDAAVLNPNRSYECISTTASPESLLEIIEKKADITDEAVLTEDNSKDVGTHNYTPKKRSPFGQLIGESNEIRRVFKVIEKVAKTDSTVLITGESGTGKELIARAIHENSYRRKKAMVVINCGAIPGELLESELFGHEKGAFTGAHRTRIGRFEMAHGSTIFLDEIGDMSPNLQVKLLRVLQEQTFERVGSTRSMAVDIRVLAATNKDLSSSIGDGSFREDLFYRLNVIPIKVAALRHRKHDIPLLAKYFLKKLSERSDTEIKIFSESALAALVTYEWPGNIRELENLMERLYVLVDEKIIQLSDLPANIRGKKDAQSLSVMENIPALPFENGIGFNEAVENYQKNLILQALEQTNWVKAKAAELLRMNRTTLVEKIKKMKIESPEL